MDVPLLWDKCFIHGTSEYNRQLATIDMVEENSNVVVSELVAGYL